MTTGAATEKRRRSAGSRPSNRDRSQETTAGRGALAMSRRLCRSGDRQRLRLGGRTLRRLAASHRCLRARSLLLPNRRRPPNSGGRSCSRRQPASGTQSGWRHTPGRCNRQRSRRRYRESEIPRWYGDRLRPGGSQRRLQIRQPQCQRHMWLRRELQSLNQVSAQ